MTERDREQSELLEAYWRAVARDRSAPLPEGLDRELAAAVQRLEGGLCPPEPEAAFTQELRRRIDWWAASRTPRRDGTISTGAHRRSPLPKGFPGRRLWSLIAALVLLATCLTLAAGVAAGGLEAPAVERFDPTGARDVAVDAPIAIAFDRPMIAPLAERALRIQPDVEGSFSWKGNTLLFMPRDGWARGTRYSVEIDQSARSIFLLPLREPVAYQFMTAADLSVLTVQPGDGALGVAPNNSLVVQFSYPIVPLGVSEGPSPFRIDPPADGKGRWLTTSLYLFQPEGGFASGVQYTVTVPAGLTDSAGGALATEHRWSFSTKAPVVSRVTPEANTRYVGPTPEIRVSFDQPVERTSAEQRFSLKGPDGTAVAGAFSWEGETLLFKPSAPLELETTYTATTAAGVKAARGGGETGEFTWSFTTVGTPRVVSTTPREGDPRYPPHDSLQIAFSNPMDRDSVEKQLAISPRPLRSHPGWQDSDTSLWLWGGLNPSTTYTITLGADAMDRYGQRLGRPLQLTFTTAPLPPRLQASLPGFVGSLNATESPTLYVEQVNVSRLDLSLHRLDQATFVRLSSDHRAREQFMPSQGGLVRAWSEKPVGERDQVSLTPTALAGTNGKLPAGFYFLRIDSPEGVSDRRLLVVSRLGLTMKRSESQVLVWATDLTSGQVVPNLPVRVADGDGRTLATGRTNQDGLLLSDGVPMFTSVGTGRQMVQIFAFAEGEGDPGVVGSDWAHGLLPYEFGIPWDPYTQPYRGHLYTDRPIYRPGQQVYFKGIVRADDDARYTLPPTSTELALEIRDSRGRTVHAGRVQLTEMGTFDGQLPLSQDAAPGNYHISARLDDWGCGVGFTVAEYRKPEFEVKVAADRDGYVHGDPIAVAGTASYYFGQPVANAQVKWRVTSRSHVFSALEGGYQFVDYDLLMDAERQGERVRTEGQTATDGQGGFAFSLPADLTRDSVSQLFTLEATLLDANNQEVSARTAAVVHKGEHYVGLRPESYVARVGEQAGVDLVAVDREGQPVPGAQVEVSFYNRQWLSVKERQPDGGYFWTSKPEDTLLSTAALTTGPDGKAKASVEPMEAGSIRVVAQVVDGRGNRMRSATYLYVAGSGYASWRMESTDRLELIPDRKEYSVGDTARVLIPSPVADAVALVTVERGRLLSHQLVRMKGNSETVEVPVLPEYLPNVYISVVLFKGAGGSGGVPTFRVGYGELKVAVKERSLRVSVAADKARYEPGERAVYAIKTTDSTGKGVPAELSLAVVDASVLALANEHSRDMLDSFWSRRQLGVSTSATLAMSVDRHNADLARENKGAGGGDETPTVRREFPDTAYWNPRVRTDERGEARVALTLPDSLTTWRAAAQGVTASTQVGSATADAIASKSLLLRPAFPRFLLMGDRLSLVTLLHNYTAGEVEVEVALAASGVQSEEGTGFAPQRVRVPAGGLQQLQWPARVESVPGGGSTAVLTLTALPLTPGVLGDSVELTLPVNTLTTAEVVATSGEVRDSTTEQVRLPEGANPALGELTIETSPSLAAGMRYSARFLEEFPYECTEQTVSRFLPRVVMQRAFDRLGLPDRDGISERLPAIVGRSLQKLYAGQRPDGGWGWWPGEGSDQWITAYAVHGLAEARRSSYAVDQGVLDRAAQYLRRSLDQPADVNHPENPNSRAYVLYAMALAGKGDPGLTNALYDRRSILGSYGRAFLLLALQAQGAGSQDGRVLSLVSDLSTSAIASATGAHWEETGVDRRTMNTNTRSTAIVLNALVKAVPDSPLIPSAVRWLMVARKDGRWETTQENAMSLLALTDYLEASGELKGDFGYRVSLNGRELATETVQPGRVDEAMRLVVEVRELLAGADNRVSVARARPLPHQSGEGKLYYTMHLRYFLPGEKVPAVAEGLALLREYYRLGDESAGPIDRVVAGETVKVKLTLVALQDLHYLVVEDPLPSGLEAVDTRLKTTSLAAREETGMVRKEDAARLKEEEAKFGAPWWRYDYFGHVEPRDDRVALFATYLPRGSYEYSYLARATTPGEFQALPTRGYEMYFPEVWGRSEGGTFAVAGR